MKKARVLEETFKNRMFLELGECVFHRKTVAIWFPAG